MGRRRPVVGWGIGRSEFEDPPAIQNVLWAEWAQLSASKRSGMERSGAERSGVGAVQRK